MPSQYHTHLNNLRSNMVLSSLSGKQCEQNWHVFNWERDILSKWLEI